jgi:hypothetical protein
MAKPEAGCPIPPPRAGLSAAHPAPVGSNPFGAGRRPRPVPTILYIDRVANNEDVFCCIIQVDFRYDYGFAKLASSPAQPHHNFQTPVRPSAYWSRRQCVPHMGAICRIKAQGRGNSKVPVWTRPMSVVPWMGREWGDLRLAAADRHTAPPGTHEKFCATRTRILLFASTSSMLSLSRRASMRIDSPSSIGGDDLVESPLVDRMDRNEQQFRVGRPVAFPDPMTAPAPDGSSTLEFEMVLSGPGLATGTIGAMAPLSTRRSL